MNVYLLRHAHAVDLGEQGIQTDEERPLSEEGHRQMQAVANGIKHLGLKFDQVLTSPLRRAMETAQDLRRHLGLPETAVVTCDELEPGVSSKKLMKRLRSLEANDMVLIGHAPDLLEDAAWLLGSKKTQVEIAKAGLAFIRCEAPPRKGVGTLVWLLPPEILGAMKG
jgi:phosphohistidine phosphatase